MAVQHERASAAGASLQCDHARPLVADELHVEPALPAPRRHELGRLALTGAAADQRRIDGIDRDEPGGEFREHDGIIEAAG